MNNKLLESLSIDKDQDIKADLEKIYNKKFVFIFNIVSLLSFIVIIYNSISSALLGLPPLSSIAMIDHHVAILQFLERVSLGIIAFITTMPFFIMLAIDKIAKYVLVSEQQERQENIAKNKNITKQMAIIDGILILLAIIAASYFIIQAITVHVSYLFIAGASVAAIYLLEKIIYQLVIGFHLEEHETGHIIMQIKLKDMNILNQFLGLFKTPTKGESEEKITKNLIKAAVAKLSYVNFAQIPSAVVSQSLLMHLYEAQLARALKNCAEGKEYKAISFNTYSNASPSTFHANLVLLDDKVTGSPIFITYAELLKNKDSDADKQKILEVIQAKHAFRNHMRSFENKDQLLAKLRDGSILNDQILDPYILANPGLSETILAAFHAEISEEQMLICSDISLELQTKLLEERLKARDELDVKIAKTLNINTGNNNHIMRIGFVIGNLNAIINGIIITSVTSNILATILPGLWLGFVISNPITLYTIMAIAFISGWYASYNMTRTAIADICENIDHVHYKKQILNSDNQNYNNLSYTMNCIITLASLGLGVLTGIQVLNMLLPLGFTLAMVSSVFIAIMTVVAGGSLFIKFIDGVCQNQQQKAIFLELHFKEEYDEQNKIMKIENSCYALSIALGLIATALTWHNMHIFAFSVLIGMVTFLVLEIIATIVVNIFCPKQAADIEHIQREICGKVAVFATSLCSMCFFMSTFISITALVAGNIGIILGAITALCIACLYAQYVWAAGASPDVYWPKKLPKIIKNTKAAAKPLPKLYVTTEVADKAAEPVKSNANTGCMGGFLSNISWFRSH
jgi:hypothetical protein